MYGISLQAAFLSFFVVASFVSFDIHFGDFFKGFPFILITISLVFHIQTCIAKGRMFFKIDKAAICLIIIAIVVTIYTFGITVDKEHSLTIWSDFIKAIALYFIIANTLRTEREILFFLFCIFACNIFIVYGYTNHPVYHWGRPFYKGSHILGDPNGISLWVISFLPLSFALFCTTRNYILKIFYLFATLYPFLAIFIAQSRGAFMALAAISLVLMKYLIKIKKIYLGFIIMIVMLAVAHRYMPEEYLWRMQGIAAPETDNTGSAQARLTTMTLALNYTFIHPFSEYGLGNHSYYIVEQYGYDITTMDKEKIFLGGNLAHSIFLQFGADTGLTPMIVYILFILFIYIKLFKANRLVSYCDGKAKLINEIFFNAFLASLTGFLAGAFFLPWSYRFFLFYITAVISAWTSLVNSRLDLNR